MINLPLRISTHFSLLLMFGLATLTGCSGGADMPDLAPVSGVVMYKGDPVVGATVSFMSDKSPRAATGVTNEKGEFQLTTINANDGAVPGTHKITVTKVEAGTGGADGPDPTANMDDPSAMTSGYTKQKDEGKLDSDAKSLIPAKYGDPKATPLSEEVKAEGENKFVLQLTD